MTKLSLLNNSPINSGAFHVTLASVDVVDTKMSVGGPGGTAIQEST